MIYKDELKAWEIKNKETELTYQSIRNQIEMRFESIEERLENEKWDLFSLNNKNNSIIENNQQLLQNITKNYNLNLQIIFQNDSNNQNDKLIKGKQIYITHI